MIWGDQMLIMTFDFDTNVLPEADDLVDEHVSSKCVLLEGVIHDVMNRLFSNMHVTNIQHTRPIDGEICIERERL